MAAPCPKCGSKNGVWNGHHTTHLGKKRRRLCRDCGCFFTVNGGFLRMRYRKEIILIAVFLYNCGLSLGKVAEFLWQLMNVKLPRKTILLWDRKYSNIIKKFVDKLKPKIKGSVHFDEVFLKVKGKQVYLWGAIDRKTKFRFSGPLTKTRSYEKGAKPLFRQVKHGSIGTPPRIVSDNLYVDICLRLGLFDPSTRLKHGNPPDMGMTKIPPAVSMKYIPDGRHRQDELCALHIQARLV